MQDALGDRMKAQYEDRVRYMLPRRTYTIVRVDGRAFHTWTRGLTRPYDMGFMRWMQTAALALCEDIAGARLGFVQSDEISVLATDFAHHNSQPWFDGNLQKIASVAASIATAAFNGAAGPKYVRIAHFDARAFTIPDPIEVENYFVWRQKDAERNSVMMLAQHHATHKELQGADRAAQHDAIHAAGDNWNDHPNDFKRGAALLTTEGGWVVDHETPIFTAQREYLRLRVPRYEQPELESHA